VKLNTKRAVSPTLGSKELVEMDREFILNDCFVPGQAIDIEGLIVKTRKRYDQ
jgi:hypothetical protein